jgi:hypothetical protein
MLRKRAKEIWDPRSLEARETASMLLDEADRIDGIHRHSDPPMLND